MPTYDGLAEGSEFMSTTRVISERDVARFAELTGDTFALHLDEAFAARSEYGRRIAHGMLVLSCSIGLAIQMNLVTESLLAFHGIDKLRFTKPVFIGDSIAVRKRVIEKRPVDLPERPETSRCGMVTFDSKVVNQNGEVVIAYVDRSLLAR